MMKDNIVLIGMPGVGKSTIGVVLAKAMGLAFVDSDLVIQEREKKLLCEIIEEDGLLEFLRIEDEINASLTVSSAVIATGGSVIYGDSAMKHLREIGTVVYLKLSFEGIKKRLGNLNKRGVALKPGQDLLSLYKERIPYYEKYADLVIDCENREISQTVEEIKQKIYLQESEKCSKL